MKNSSAFVERVNVIELEARDHHVSFDVTNLFSQVPVDEALKVLEERLSANDTLRVRTCIPVPRLTELIKICLRATFFQFQDTFYEQLDRAAMGLLLSPMVANLYMEHLEETALQTSPDPPCLWLRYVDDTFVIWLHGQEKLDCFHEHLNTQHRNIKFTAEHEKVNKLAFPGVQVTKECNLSYIGETKHTLRVRIGEHKQAVKPGELRNAIAVHAHQSQHAINWDGAKVKRSVNRYWKRTTEAIHI